MLPRRENELVSRRALITGITGQDGSYLTEFLLAKGYQVFGVVRRHSSPDRQLWRLHSNADRVCLIVADLLDPSALRQAVLKAQPDEIYNLAGQSHVGLSFQVPQITFETNANAVISLLEIIRETAPQARLYQASSSEMFGVSIDSDGFQRESTVMKPCSPYGCSKLAAYSAIRTYRDAYGLFAANGILFNHESPRRGATFVTQKIVNAAVQIKQRKLDRLQLGRHDILRDWGHAADYVKAMWSILQHDSADDFVIATGRSETVEFMCARVFEKLDLNYRDFVYFGQSEKRPSEPECLRGDSAKARRTLGWEPEWTLETLLDDMLAGAFAQSQEKSTLKEFPTFGVSA